MALRITPAAPHPSSTTNLTTRSAVPSSHAAPGLPDPLNTQAPNPAQFTSPHNHTPELQSAHPLEARLRGWRATQHALKMTGLRRAYGMAEPVRREMELLVARGGEWRPACLGGSAGVSGDILEGRDWCIEWEDVFRGGEGGMKEEGMGGEMERRVGMRSV